ncbi:MAG: hypothetical protein EA395_02770, partial [Phormidium sp. GEM2.Bin31]
MAPNPKIMEAVEGLNYRVTVGDVASQAGLDVNLAQKGLLALASDANAHLQVAETGDIVYDFPRNFRNILRGKFLRLRFQAWWDKIWNVLFYLIRISFGTLLIVSIILIFVAITIIIVALNSNRDSNSSSSRSSSRSGGGGFFFIPRFWIGDLFWFYDPNPERKRRRKAKAGKNSSEMNFLEAVFSFLFGDGNPNADLEERRWKEIAQVIRNHNGVVVAEQIAPYLDDLGNQFARETEDYMIPVLSKFDGSPEVSPEGELVYRFPELQVTAKQQRRKPVEPYLTESPWTFSQADSGQISMSIGLGSINIIGGGILGVLLQDQELVAELGGLVAFVDSIYWLLIAYGVAFLTVPLVRYFWIKRRNQKVQRRNAE